MVKVVYQVKYEASDGKFFNTEEQALKHEKNLKITEQAVTITRELGIFKPKIQYYEDSYNYSESDLINSYNRGVTAAVIALLENGKINGY